MILIPGYQLGEEIGESGKTTVYRGRREKDGKNVIIKTSSQTALFLNDFRRQYETSRNIDIDGIVKIERLESCEDGIALIMEDFGGVSLKKIILAHAAGLKDYLRITAKLADILGRMHTCQLIHGDIKPSNIIVNLHTGEVKITDLGSSRVYATDESQYASVLPGTLTYMSPEQTGRMNRMTDYRTDFYSLGITFFEMFAGEPPFRSDEPIEMIYWHIAKTPRSLIALDLQTPAVIAQIVDKLLAKNPEDRYQSAYGLKHDLDKCLTMLEEHERVAAFPIAEKDVAEYLNLPHKVYGREQEKMVLLEAYDRIAHGKSEVVLVQGSAGTGKTTLISETFRSIIPQGAFFIEGKYDQVGREIPYSAIIKALSGLIQHLLTQSQEKLAAWKEALQAALGVNGRIIIDVIPEVELIIGEQPEIPSLGPAEAKNVFDFIFQAFFQVFTRQEHPLVMFLDDLQHADPASLRLMELVLTDMESRHFLLVGAYREGEVGMDHPLHAMLSTIRHAGVSMATCSLGPLGIDEITAMLTDMLSRTPQEPRHLAALIVTKTGGNAFFVNQFIDKIHREKLLTFNIEEGSWQWDLEAIAQMSVTDNVTKLLIDKLNTMPEEVRSVMSLAACIGSTFHPSLLAEVRKVPLSEMINPLRAAVQEGFLLPLRGVHLWEGLPVEAGGYRFLHDRIQEACYAIQGPQEVREAHLAIGRTMLRTSSQKPFDESIFEIMSHFLKGMELIADENEQLELARLTLAAGTKAKSSTAYDQACAYLSAGMELVREDIWQTDYPFAFALYRERSECEYLAGNHEQALRLFDLTLGKARSNLDKAEIYRIRMALDAKVGLFVEHQKLCIEALKLFDIHLPDLTDKEAQEKAITDEILRLKHLLGTRKIADLINLPTITHPEKMACQKLLMDALSSAYVSNPTFFAIGTLTLVNITLTYGVSKDSNYTFVVWGMLLGIRFQQYETAFELGTLALKLNERFQTTSNRCMVPFVIGNFINHWRRHVRFNMEYLREAFQAGMEIGDFVYGSFSAMSITRVALSYGHDHLESVLDDVETSLAFFKRIKNYPALERQELVKQTVLNLLGLTQSSCSLNSATFNEADHLEKMQAIKYGTGIALFYLYKAQTLYLSENYAEALEMAEQAMRNILFITCMMQESDCLLFHSLIITALYPAASDADKEKFDQALHTNQYKTKTWADNCPENFLARYQLVEAEIARVTGDFGKACRLFDEAIQCADENGFIFLAALANELAAKCYLAHGTIKATGAYLDDALSLYRTWGAQGKVKDLEEKYRQIIKPRRKEGPAQTGIPSLKTEATPPSGTSGLLTDMIDLTSIIKSSQAISGEIHFHRLIEKLMHILIENAGAQSGFLIIEHGGTLCISAQESAEAGIVVTERSTDHDAAMRDYPYAVIQYVQRTGERIVLNKAAEEGLFVTDPYIAANRPRSILCMPVIEQSKVVGILYLENRLLKDAFTPERIRILELLSSQAAISIKNSLNYEEINRTKEELQESKEKLQESLDEYSNLFENIQDVFYRTDLAGNLILLSPSFGKILGYTLEESLHINLLDIYRYPEQRRLLEMHLQEKGFVENFETELRKKDGTYIWISANSHQLKDKKGNVIGIEGMARDITTRKQAEAMLLDEKERLSVMLRSIGDGVIATNSDGVIILMNKVAEDLTGWTQEEARGHDLGDIFQVIEEHSRSHRMNPLETVSTGDTPTMTGQALLMSRAGTEKLIAENAAPIRDKDGRIAGAIIVFRDITERRKLELEILKNQKLESIGLFAGGIAHDFNNILTGIMGNISLARVYSKPGDKAAAKLSDAEKAVLRAKDLTQQLLTFSKGGSPVKKTASITELLKESARFILSGSNIKSVFSLPESIWPVDVDEGQFNQVINNLTLNAVQAMPRGGTITIAAVNVHVPSDSPLPLSEGDYVKISMHDEGIGIPPENLAKIFDPFFSTKPKGNGLGLATTYSIIRKHDGHIEVESQEGIGTSFFIYLPASKRPLVPKEERPQQQDDFRKGKVLLMDDEEMILETGQEMLAYLGYEVTKARNGAEAIQLYASARQEGSPFQAVIMDLTIPGGMGGKDAILKLREIDPAVKAIVSSGYSNDPVMADYQNLGFAGMIIKPYRIDEIKKVMQEVLS